RQAMLLGDGRRIRGIGATPARSACLLTRGRRSRLLLRWLWRILGARAGHYRQHEKRKGEAPMAQRGDNVHHVRSSPVAATSLARPRAPHAPAFTGWKPF